jgi:hypothetical protein
LTRTTLLKERALKSAQFTSWIGPNIKEATEDAARRAADFVVARTKRASH